MDRPERGAMAGPAGRVSFALDVLAAVARLGRARRVVDDLADVSRGVESQGPGGLEGSVHRRQFRVGEKRGAGVGKTKRGKGTKWMVVVDGQGVPLGNHLGSASPAEVKLAETTLATIRVPNRCRRGRPQQKPQRLIADKAYDSDPLRRRLKQRGIELVAPHKAGRVRPATQDGRALRRYRKRWKIERTNAWLGNFRHLVVRYDRKLNIYQAFFQIACFMIVLRRL
jgi:transposase